MDGQGPWTHGQAGGVRHSHASLMAPSPYQYAQLLGRGDGPAAPMMAPPGMGLPMGYAAPPPGPVTYRTNPAPTFAPSARPGGLMPPREADEGVNGIVTEDIFTSYRCSLEYGSDHPGHVVESTCLRHTPLPPCSYKLAIPQEVIDEGRLSGLQLETIVYASQRHLTILPSGQRMGFFVGDSAGVGKGRQIAGLILENICRGREKNVWISVSTDLYLDACRDLEDLGCHATVINGCQQVDRETKGLGLGKQYQTGVFFCTYATLVSGGTRGGPARMDQIVKWCGGADYDGCLVFDECHKAKNFNTANEKASSKVARCVVQLQQLLPKARVLYSSATGVTDISTMAFMERLGLWGSGLVFADYNEFVSAMSRRGIGSLEMLAMDLKSSGSYVSRSLSFKEAEFEHDVIALSPEQIAQYDDACTLWMRIFRMMNEFYGVAKTWKSAYWGAHQRFFKQLCVSLKAPAIADIAKAALADGMAVVIGLQTTGEAASERAKKGMQDSLLSVAEDILLNYINTHFPPSLAKEAGEMKERAQALHLPVAALDNLIDSLGGPDHVAEMTGRRQRLIRAGRESSKYMYESREGGSEGDMDMLNVRESRAFMDGRKNIAIISDAASTGISLHCDRKAINVKRRCHITLELAWSADKTVQQLGRSHRSNQVVPPLYRLVTTDVSGERRFAVAVSKRLEALGAITKGDRRGATGMDLAQFNYDTKYGMKALKEMFAILREKRLPEYLSWTDIARDIGSEDPTFMSFADRLCEGLEFSGLDINPADASSLVSRSGVKSFFNKVLGVFIEYQNLAFRLFLYLFNATIRNAKLAGTYSEGIVDIQASRVDRDQETEELYKDPSNGAITFRHRLAADRGISWEKSLELHEENKTSNKINGFYRSKEEIGGRTLVLLARASPDPSLAYIIRPNTGYDSKPMYIKGLLNSYVKVKSSSEKIRKEWIKTYERTYQSCVHGSKCKRKNICTVGTRIRDIHILAGNILGVWSTLQSVRSGNSIYFEDDRLDIIRTELSDGERIVGISFPPDLADATNDAFQEMKSSATRVNSMIEDVAEVNENAMKKALTKPVTIQSFFTRNAKETKHQGESSRPAISTKLKRALSSEPSNKLKRQKSSGIQTTLSLARKVNQVSDGEKAPCSEDVAPSKFVDEDVIIVED